MGGGNYNKGTKTLNLELLHRQKSQKHHLSVD